PAHRGDRRRVRGGAGVDPPERTGRSGPLRGGSDALQWGPAEQQALLADLGEAHHGLGLLTLPDDVDDHALAPLAVADVVADPEAQRLRAARDGASRSQRGLDDLVARAVALLAPLGRTPRARAAARFAAALGELHQRGGDLVEEPAGGVVLRRPVQHPAPRMREVQALA